MWAGSGGVLCCSLLHSLGSKGISWRPTKASRCITKYSRTCRYGLYQVGTENALARLKLDYFEQKEVQLLGLLTSSLVASRHFAINLNGIYTVHWIWECVNQCASLKRFHIPLFSQLKHFMFILSLNYLGNLHHFIDKCAVFKMCWLKQILWEWYKNWQLIRNAYFALQRLPLG